MAWERQFNQGENSQRSQNGQNNNGGFQNSKFTKPFDILDDQCFRNLLSKKLNQQNDMLADLLEAQKMIINELKKLNGAIPSENEVRDSYKTSTEKPPF